MKIRNIIGASLMLGAVITAAAAAEGYTQETLTGGAWIAWLIACFAVCVIAYYCLDKELRT